jgi:hypothetical protein
MFENIFWRIIFVTVCVFVSSILFWFPQCTRYFWRVFQFLFLERKLCRIIECLKMTTFKIVFTFDVFFSAKTTSTARWHAFYIRNRHISVSSFVYKYDQWPHMTVTVLALKKTSKVNTILKVVIFKHSIILFRCSMICRWSEPWNFKTCHFRISNELWAILEYV